MYLVVSGHDYKKVGRFDMLTDKIELRRLKRLDVPRKSGAMACLSRPFRVVVRHVSEYVRIQNLMTVEHRSVRKETHISAHVAVRPNNIPPR
jgi:hypothetical protein